MVAITRTAQLTTRNPIPENMGSPEIVCATPTEKACVMPPAYPTAEAQNRSATDKMESNPQAMQTIYISGRKARYSSQQAAVAEIREKMIRQMGTRMISLPAVALIMLLIPACRAPVASTILNTPPRIRRKNDHWIDGFDLVHLLKRSAFFWFLEYRHKLLLPCK